MQVGQVTSCDYNFLLSPYQTSRKTCKKCECTTITLTATTSRISMGLPRPAISEEHATHFLRSCICCTHDQSLLWVEGVYFSLGHGHLIFSEIAFFFFQQPYNIQFLNSSRMELCLMASWWM